MSQLTYKKVAELLAERVAPYLASHGGKIELLKVTPEGEVHISVHGACANCPSLGDTISSAVEGQLTEAFPGEPVKIVVENNISDELWSMAKRILRKEQKEE